MITKKRLLKDYVDAKSALDRILEPLTLGALLDAIRRGEEMNQTAFAKKLRISKSHVCDIEKGRKSVSPARAAEFAKRLGYSESQFVLLALQDLLRRDGLSYSVKVEAA